MRRAVALLFLGVVASLPAPADANASHAIRCSNATGFRGRPMIRDAKTAKAIFVVVERSVYPQADLDNYRVIKALDRGDHWTVFRTARTKEVRSGDVITELIVVAGGGQLGLDVDKCSGAITHATLQK
jgi:hypothetical protein